MKYLTLAAGLLSLGSALAQSVSTEGNCGGSGSITCQGSGFGNCCSQYGWVGESSYRLRRLADYISVALPTIIVAPDVNPNSVHVLVAMLDPHQSPQALPWWFAPRLDHLRQLLLHPRRRSLRMVLVVATADRRVRDQDLEIVAPAVAGVEAHQRTAIPDVSQVSAAVKAV
jgi:hypothetical protein